MGSSLKGQGLLIMSKGKNNVNGRPKDGKRIHGGIVAKPSKLKTKNKIKQLSKLSRYETQKLDDDLEEIQDVRNALEKGEPKREKKNILDAGDLREGLIKDEESKKNSKVVEDDIAHQLQLLNGMGI